VQDVAARFQEPLRTQYVAAAKDFRIPYWDWALNIRGQTSAFPTAVSSSTATVVDTDGATKQIPNPLYTFRFDDKDIPSELVLDDDVGIHMSYNAVACT
jgi:tyrosinase